MYPQVVDLTGDGVMDIVSGSYLGDILMFKGVKGGGFLPADTLKEALANTKENYNELVYSNPTYADFNGDGLLDAFVGGIPGLRVMLNVGTKENPVFGTREPLLTVNGDVVSSTKRQTGSRADNFKSFVNFVDWDNDGIGDLITSHTNNDGGNCYPPILFHKGVILNGELRFEEGVALIKPWASEKVLPGSAHNLTVADYNGDGVNDILIGIKMRRILDTDKFDMNVEYEFDLYSLIDQIIGVEKANIRKEIPLSMKEEREKRVETMETRISKFKNTLSSGSYKYSGYVILIEGESEN